MSGTTSPRDELELAALVAERPEEDALATGLGVARQQFGAVLRRPDADLPAQLVRLSAENRRQHAGEHPIGLGPVLRDPGPHRRETVREGGRVAASICQGARKPGARRREALRRGVVGGREPAVAQPGGPGEAGARAPAADPQRDPAWRLGSQLDLAGHAVVAPVLRWRVAVEQRAQHGQRLVQALPAFLEGDAEGVVVARRRARADGGDEAPTRDQVDRGERLRERHGTAQDGERHRRRECHVARSLDHARERGRPVEPRCLEDEVVVRAQRREPALPRRVDRKAKAFLRKRLLAELHQRQMYAQLHRSAAYSSRPIFARYSVSVAPPIAVRTDSLKRSVRRSGRKRRSARACLRGLRSP